MKFYSYPKHVIDDVIDYFEWNFNEQLTKFDVEIMEPESVLSYYLEWNGIIGYKETIMRILNS